MAVLLLQVLMFGYGRDQAVFALVGRSLLEGGMPYRDAWDIKPPGIFLIYAAARALFGGAQIGIRVLEVAGLALMCWGMVRLAARLWHEPRIGFVAAVLALIAHARLDFWSTAQPETFGGMLTIAGLLCAVPHGDRAASPYRLFLCGALFSAAGLLKPPLVGGAAVVALYLLNKDGWKSRESAARVTALSAGVIVPVVVCAAWFELRGALPELYEVLFRYTPHHTRLGWQDASWLSMSYRLMHHWFVESGPLMSVGLVALLVPRIAPFDRAGIVLLGGIIGVHALGVLLQAKFFAYHWGATWPLAALLAARGFWKVRAVAVSRGSRQAGLFYAGLGALCLLSMISRRGLDDWVVRPWQRLEVAAGGFSDVAELDRMASGADTNASANRAVAAFLRARVPAEQHIFVWGFEPVIYDLADRNPATRYIYNVPQRVDWNGHAARTQLLADLAARPPGAIIVVHRDGLPAMTGDARDSFAALQDVPELTALLEHRYILAQTIEDFDIYLANETR